MSMRIQSTPCVVTKRSLQRFKAIDGESGFKMTVFAVQMQMRFDNEKRELVERFPSINRADKWGKIKFILSPSANPFKPELVIGDIHECLSGFNDNDYLLLIGNPVLIGMATAIAANNSGGLVNFLQWSGRHNTYTEITARLF